MSTQNQGDHLGYQQDHGVIVPSHAAATATEDVDVFVAERACRVKKLDYYPRAAITGQATNKTQVQATKNGAGGSGGTALGTLQDYDNGTNAAANTKVAQYAPTTPLAMAVGDRITLRFTKVGTGLLIPDLFVRVVVDFEP